ncbi:hypothetical protein D3C81_588900 [compost metagenome]
MPYVLSFTHLGSHEKSFDTVSDALTFYEDIQKIGIAGLNYSDQLRCHEKGTFVTLFPGISVQIATFELESVWEWEPEDRLKIRPKLKQRYQTTA